MHEMTEEMRHFFSQLVQNNPGLNVQNMPGCSGSNIPSSIDASTVQDVRGKNHPNSSGSIHAPVLEKAFYVPSYKPFRRFSIMVL